MLHHYITSLKITSWVAATLLFMMGVITGIRVLLWINGNRCRKADNSLVSHDELQQAADDDDDQPLPI